ncbi:uroporphyrinogen-III synthase [Tessaracoccus rhinocerotis]|uniref:uroporphyrinogen-III synthase n=1 Tax=Tessaracoccus rhinocerotis TaxID=1689449 RepID=UPI00163DADD8|nr:uroporphyrinogen-III synthase [Tessaracoccus rhinocerotis]
MDAVSLPLAGLRIAVTSDRRSEELIDALVRRGADVTHVPLLRLAPLADEAPLLEQTRRVIAARPEVLLVSTADGFRRWFASAEAAGLADELSEAVDAAAVYVRGAKAHGVVRGLGFRAAGISDDGTVASLVPQLNGRLRGATVAVQLQLENDLGLPAALRRLGAAHVLKVEPYRWLDSATDPEVAKLVDGLCAAHFDAVTFTSAPAAVALINAAHRRNRGTALVRSLNERVVVATVGPVTAAPLEEAGVHRVLVPERHRMGAMILQLVDHLSGLGTLTRDTVHGPCVLRGRTLDVDGEQCELSPTQAAMVRCLMEADGSVVSRDELCAALPSVSTRHALDMALSRLRRMLPKPDLITTVTKRGYRLNSPPLGATQAGGCVAVGAGTST